MQKRPSRRIELQQRMQAAAIKELALEVPASIELPGQLPADVATLQAIVLQQRAQHTLYESALRQTKALIEQLQQQSQQFDERMAQALAKEQAKHQAQVAQLLEQIRLSRHRMFGVSSEQLSAQGRLFDEADVLAAQCSETEPAAVQIPAAVTVTEAKAANEVKPITPAARGKRAPLPEALPRVDIVHEVPDSERVCPCGAPMALIGTEVSEQLDIVPMQVRVLRHIRNKYACPGKDHQGPTPTAPITAPMPEQLLPKSNASAELIAMIATLKYIDGVPLARTERKFEGFGVALPRQTQARWMVKVGKDALQPLVNLARDALYEHDVIHLDETTVQVLSGTGKSATSKNYMWVQTGGPPDKPVTLFHYAPSREARVADALLADWQGYAMVDGYSGYNQATQEPKIKRLGCWAHARRYFVEAQVADPKSKQPASTASRVIALIGKLYAIERAEKESLAEQRLAVRQSQSTLVLASLRQWLDQALASVPPKAALGKALNYLHNQWPHLIGYTERGDLPIDNNRAENALRPFVIGRKNWLFSDTVHGAKASANWYSLIETAKANGLEPHTWLRHVLNNIAAAKTPDQYEELMPWRVKREGPITLSK